MRTLLAVSVVVLLGAILVAGRPLLRWVLRAVHRARLRRVALARLSARRRDAP